MPQGKQAYNPPASPVLLSDKLTQATTGVTVSRYCASSLDAIRHASNAVKNGEGDIYIAAGVEFVSQFNARTEIAGSIAAGGDDQNENLIGNNGQPNAYIDMGLTAVNVANDYGVSREAMDDYALRSQHLAVASQESGFFDREIVPVTLPDGTVVSKDDGPRADGGDMREARQPARGLRRRRRHRRQLLPLNDGAAAVLIMSDTKAAELGLTRAREDHHLGHRRQ